MRKTTPLQVHCGFLLNKYPLMDAADYVSSVNHDLGSWVQDFSQQWTKTICSFLILLLFGLHTWLVVLLNIVIVFIIIQIILSTNSRNAYCLCYWKGKTLHKGSAH